MILTAWPYWLKKKQVRLRPLVPPRFLCTHSSVPTLDRFRSNLVDTLGTGQILRSPCERLAVRPGCAAPSPAATLRSAARLAAARLVGPRFVDRSLPCLPAWPPAPLAHPFRTMAMQGLPPAVGPQIVPGSRTSIVPFVRFGSSGSFGSAGPAPYFGAGGPPSKEVEAPGYVPRADAPR